MVGKVNLKFRICIFCILSLLLAGVACAESVISVPLEGPGEDGSLTVKVSGISGVSGVSFILKYNQDSLTVEGANIGSSFSGSSLTKTIDNSAGTAKFVIICNSAIDATDTSDLLNVKFNVIDTADKAVSINDAEWSDSVDYIGHEFDVIYYEPISEPTSGLYYSNESIILYSGWNFISTPKRLDTSGGNNTAGKLFQDIDSGGHSALMYNGSSEKWEVVKADTIIKPLDALWIYSNSNEKMEIGLTFDSNPLQAPPSKYLNAEWNSLGYSSTEPATARDTLLDISEEWTKVIGWDAEMQSFEYTIINGGSGNYTDSRPMLPGKGYWVWMKEEGKIASIAINSEGV